MNSPCLPMENMLYIFNTFLLKSTFCNLVPLPFPLSTSFLSSSLPFCLPLPSQKTYIVKGQNNLYSIVSFTLQAKSNIFKMYIFLLTSFVPGKLNSIQGAYRVCENTLLWCGTDRLSTKITQLAAGSSWPGVSAPL